MGDRSASAPPELDAFSRRIASSFDARAPGYDDDTSWHGPLAAELVWLAALKPGERALDLACGTGLVALPAAEAVGEGGRVVGVDVSEGMLARARAKADAAGLGSRTEWVHGNAEDPLTLAAFEEGSFHVVSCSAALPFIRDIPGALRRWRAWLHPTEGRLVFNGFVAPAVEDFGTFIEVAARHGLDIADPCARVGTKALVEAACAAAGFSSVDVREEPRQRWHAAASAQEHADKMYAFSAQANPFSPVDETVLPAPALAAFRADALSEIARRAGPRFEAGRGVRSSTTILHVLARV